MVTYLDGSNACGGRASASEVERWTGGLGSRRFGWDARAGLANLPPSGIHMQVTGDLDPL